MRFIIRHENCGQKALNAYTLINCYSKCSEILVKCPSKSAIVITSNQGLLQKLVQLQKLFGATKKNFFKEKTLYHQKLTLYFSIHRVLLNLIQCTDSDPMFY